MSKMIQIRNVPDALHRKLKSRAALAGMSLSDYLLAQIREIAARPTMEEMIARIERLPPIEVDLSPTEILRAERDSR
jgi:plasmid stability protein